MTPAPTSAKLKLMLCPPLACAHGPRCARCIRSCCAVLEHALMAIAALGAFAHAVLSLSMRSWPSLRSVHSLMLVPPCACAHGPRCARCIRSCVLDVRGLEHVGECLPGAAEQIRSG